ncbi:hypothetical protein LTS15_010368 [Exophiala xenobiotica]|nr:hypothetical protein LTS15_010368 [Exophiala xenobiotica]
MGNQRNQCWDHPYHCHRPRQNCAPGPAPAPTPAASGGNTTNVQNLTNVTVYNITYVIQANPSGPLPPVIPSGGTAPSGGAGTIPAPLTKAPPSRYDAIYLIDLWEAGTFPSSSNDKDWRVHPVAKAIWYYSNAQLETMNAGPLPDLEFQVPGNLPNGFDWEAYTIDCTDAKKTMTIRTGIIEGANTVGRNFLLPGDGSCRTVGSAGRYVKDAAFGVVIPIRRDERSTLMTTVKNPDYGVAGKVTSKVQYLEARCRYYISCAPPPRSQIELVANKETSATERLAQGQNGFVTFAAFGPPETSEVAAGTGDGAQSNDYIEPPAKLVGGDDDVEEAPNEKYDQMEASTLPEGFDAGSGEKWTGKLISEVTLMADPELEEERPDADDQPTNPGTQTDNTQQSTNPGSQIDNTQQPTNPGSQTDNTQQQDGSTSQSTAPVQQDVSASQPTAPVQQDTPATS